jgi:hypothetical protein
MTIRERCEKLFTDGIVSLRGIDIVESLIRDIRTEALEEALKVLTEEETYNPIEGSRYAKFFAASVESKIRARIGETR